MLRPPGTSQREVCADLDGSALPQTPRRTWDWTSLKLEAAELCFSQRLSNIPQIECSGSLCFVAKAGSYSGGIAEARPTFLQTAAQNGLETQPFQSLSSTHRAASVHTGSNQQSDAAMDCPGSNVQIQPSVEVVGGRWQPQGSLYEGGLWLQLHVATWQCDRY